MLERTAKAAKSHLENELADALDAQEAYWTGEGDPVTLPDVDTWLFGHNPTVVERVQADFPVVAAMAFNADPGERADQWGFGEEQIALVVNWFVAADDEEDCNKICLRYGEAIKSVLRDHEKLETKVHLAAYVPETRLSLVTIDYPDTGATAFYTQMGQQTWPVRARP